MKRLLLNWGFTSGIFQRFVIILITIWTFLFYNLQYIQQKGLVFRQGIFIILIFILPYLAWKKNISSEDYPYKTDAVILTPIFLDTLGNFFGQLAYGQFGYLDKVAHLWGSGVFTFLIFVVLASYLHSVNVKPKITSLFILSLTVGFALEGFWELWEYAYDMRYGTILVNNLSDTMGDMASGLFGGLIISGICCVWYLKSKSETKDKYLFTLSRLFG